MLETTTDSQTPAETRRRAWYRALALLERVKHLRQWRAKMTRLAGKRFGWEGPLISGCERTHWPEELKDQLRANAREIADTLDQARDEWRNARKRHQTWLRTAERYRVEGCRY